MTKPNDPDLVGFLLGALDTEEHAELEREIDESPELGLQSGLVRQSLKRLALDCRPDHELPRPMLTERTCQWLWEQIAQPARISDVTPADLSFTSRLSMADMVVAFCAVVIGLAVLLPALETNRFQAGILACQQKLQALSSAAQTYSVLQPDHGFPRLEPVGNRAAAGIYAPTLVSRQLVQGDRAFVCPKSQQAASLAANRLPTLEEIDQATGSDLRSLHSRMGGTYAYNLGHVSGGTYVSPVNRLRENIPLLADAPPADRSQGVSTSHNASGTNVLYEDGHVKFHRQFPVAGIMDDPFLNRDGFVAAGTGPDDVVLGRSDDHPLTVEFNPTQIRLEIPRK